MARDPWIPCLTLSEHFGGDQLTFLNTESTTINSHNPLHRLLVTLLLMHMRPILQMNFPVLWTQMKAFQTVRGDLPKPDSKLSRGFHSTRFGFGYLAHSVNPHRKADLWSCALALRLTPDHTPTSHRDESNAMNANLSHILNLLELNEAQ